MKTYILSFFLLISYAVKAQITMNQSDFVTAGDIIYMANDSNCTTSPGNSGSNLSWNLASLSNHSIDTSWFLSPAGNPGAALFPAATMVQKMGDGGGGYFYAYYQVTSTFVDMLGFSDGTSHTPYDIPYRQFVFPATYNTAFSGTSSMHFTYPYPLPPYDSGRISITIQYSSLIDGWGNVTTPTGTYGSLRQRMVTNQFDSTFLHDAVNNTWTWDGTPPTPNTDDTGFNWVAKTTKFNVAGISINSPGTIPPATGTYLLSTATLLSENNLDRILKVYPNPLQTESIIESDLPFQDASLKICNIVGEVVKKMEHLQGNQIHVYRDHLPAGVYYIQITEKDKLVTTRKLLITE